jgi:hypothetical protein
MSYITNVAGMPLLYGYQRNSYRHRYVTGKVQTYREELLRQYAKPSSRGKLAEYHYICLSPRARVHGSANKKSRQDALDWARLLYQVSTSYSNNHKEVAVKNSKKMVFELMTWECLPDVDTVRQYLGKHPFPQDKLYPEKAFLEDVQRAVGYTHLVVEKRETAEFVCDLCSDLI